MTLADWKQYDKRLRGIADPFGTGFPKLRKLMQEWSAEQDISTHDLTEQYMAWKWRR